MGRPSKLDDLTAQRIVAAVKKGLPRTQAARLARIHPATLFDWLAKGRKGDPEYAEFSERVAEAEAFDVEELVGFMRAHAKESWQACSWLLGVRHPKQFTLRKGDPTTLAKPGEIATTSSEERMSLLESLMDAERSAAG